MQPDWHQHARCYALPTEDALKFFGDSSDPITPMTQHRWAQMFCRECPVRLECLRSCLESDTQAGVWGGLTESQRKRYLAPLMASEGKTDDVLWKAMKRCDGIVKEPPQELVVQFAAVSMR